jgi:hypothetical protein
MAVSFLLLEDGVSYLLLEDGTSKLILETGPLPPGAGAVAGVVSYDVAVVSGRRVASYE